MQLISKVKKMSFPSKYHFESMCRTCLHHDTSQCLLSIFDYCGDESKKTRIVEILCTSTPQLVIQMDDTLPKTICTVCKDKLLDVHKFQQMCLRSEKRLHSVLQCDADDAPPQQPLVFETKIVVSPLQKFENNDNHGDFVCGVREVSNYLKLEINEKEDVDQLNPLNSDANTNIKNVTVASSASESEKNDETSDGVASGGRRRKLRKRKKSTMLTDSDVNIKTEEETTASSCEEELPCDNLKIFPCSDCGQCFKDMLELSEHSRVHNKEEKRYACNYCDCRYFRATHLRRHERNKHPNRSVKSALTCSVPSPAKKLRPTTTTSKEYFCEIETCGDKFKSSSSLARHRRTQHKHHDGSTLVDDCAFKTVERSKPFVCKYCDKAFQQSCTLKDHIRTHTGEQPFLCSECGKAFNSSSNMKQHLLRHTGEKRYECPSCPKKFPCLSDLASHKAVHNKIKRHICDVCGAAFGKPYQLKKHKMYHNNDKPHKCEYCEQRFVCADHMRRHLRTHTGEKPYKCKYCERAFAQSNDLIKHLRSHLGENVYKCELCPLAFRLATELRTHFAVHKNDDEETRQRNLNDLLEQEAKVRMSMTGKQQNTLDAYIYLK